MLDLNHLRLFVEIVKVGSFVGTARRLGVPTNTVTRHIQLLEAAARVRLLHRSTRKLTFRYVWTALHPAMAIFGEQIPEVGRKYLGEAILVRNGKVWTVAHWTTPELDSPLEKFKEIGK